jgi:hypothetical protein
LDIIFSLGASANDANPTRTASTWEQLAQWLHALPRSPAGITPERYAYLKGFPTKSPEGMELHADKSGPYIVLADFGAGQRRLTDVLTSCGVPLDFDDGVNIDDIRRVLTGYTFMACSTYAHSEASPRWRVFVPVARPMSAAEHYATWEMLNAAFSGGADPAAKDPSRLSYLPGKCLYPEQAATFFKDGAFLQPAPVVEKPLDALQAHSGSGPVPGWAGPVDDETLIAIACTKRMRPDEAMGQPVHFAMLWQGNEAWLAQQFPPSASEQGQAYSRTKADMALAGELGYFTGSDRERMHRLMMASGLRREDEDWLTRKCLRAIDLAIGNATKWHFMQPAKQPATVSDEVTEMTVNIGVAPPPPPDKMPDTGTAPPPPPDLGFVGTQLANAPVPGAMVGLNDYWSFHQTGEFIYRPTGDMHPATVLDNVIGKDARIALYSSRPVHRLTWAPGFPERFQQRDLDDTDHKAVDAWMYNTYRPPKPAVTVGDATPWLQLLESRYPDDMDHIINYFADAVQTPDKKCNHALVFGSRVHGIGKDTLLAPLIHAVGQHNFRIIKPQDLASPYNGYVMSRVVQVSESRDLGEGQRGISRYDMYERCKDLAAAPPTTVGCEDKYLRKHWVLNVHRLILTTNHAVDGLYIDPEDRRHYCAWSDAAKLTEEETKAIWGYYAAGGLDIVANYLATIDLDARGWSRTKPPLQTNWWRQLVEGGRTAEDDRFTDVMEKLQRPEWLTLNMVAEAGGLELTAWMIAPGNRRKVEREMDKSGYARLSNPNEPGRGRWHVNGGRAVVYRRCDIPEREMLAKFGA